MAREPDMRATRQAAAGVVKQIDQEEEGPDVMRARALSLTHLTPAQRKARKSEQHRRWREANPDRFRDIQRRYNAGVQEKKRAAAEASA
jgi:hypothetical protein